MKTLAYKGFEGTAEVDFDREICRGKLLFIEDLVTFEATTPAQLRKEFEAAVDDYLETCEAVGKEPQRPFRGTFNVRVPPDIHRLAAIKGVQEGVSLNEVVVRALDCYLHAGTEINNHFTINLERSVQTLSVAPSDETEWKLSTPNVH